MPGGGGPLIPRGGGGPLGPGPCGGLGGPPIIPGGGGPLIPGGGGLPPAEMTQKLLNMGEKLSQENYLIKK